MTVKEVAEALGVSERTVQRHAKEVFNHLDNVVEVENGKATVLSELQVTEIKNRIAKSGRFDLPNVAQAGDVVTELEKNQTIFMAMQYLQERYTNAIKQAEIAETNARTLQITLDKSKEWYSIKRMEKLNKGQCFPWQLLKKESKRMGVEIKKAFDANYGEVNTYHVSVWESLYFDTLNF